MKPPREFWITDNGGPSFEIKVSDRPLSSISTLFREVREIDWNRVWEFLDKYIKPELHREKLEQLVDEQIKGSK